MAGSEYPIIRDRRDLATRNQRSFSLELKEQSEKNQREPLEVPKSNKLHDSFIVADDKIFHVGASIKDAGEKMFFMSECKGSDIKRELSRIICGYWSEAKIVL